MICGKAILVQATILNIENLLIFCIDELIFLNKDGSCNGIFESGPVYLSLKVENR